MKLKKHLFPCFLALAVLLTVSGLVSANISFSAPVTTTNGSSFNIVIDNVQSENIDVISAENSSISYVLELSNIVKDYSVSFDVTNDSNFNVVLDKTIMDQIPEELKNIINVDVKTSKSILSNKKDRVVITYSTKEELTEEEYNVLDNYKELKVNVIFNYTQE